MPLNIKKARLWLQTAIMMISESSVLTVFISL
jgi:hypothetical protein